MAALNGNDPAAMPHIGVDAFDVLNADHGHNAASRHGHTGGMKAHGASHKAVNGACSACASCCLGATFPASFFLTFEAVLPTDSFVMAARDDAVSFLTGRLERPPRSFLA